MTEDRVSYDVETSTGDPGALQEYRDSITEDQLLTAIAELAQSLGYLVAHFRPARTASGWRTPVAFDGKGFVDLLMAHEQKRVLIAAEVKVGKNTLSPEQRRWAEVLGAVMTNHAAGYPPVVRYCAWWDEHWHSGEIEAILRGGV